MLPLHNWCRSVRKLIIIDCALLPLHSGAPCEGTLTYLAPSVRRYIIIDRALLPLQPLDLFNKLHLRGLARAT